DRMAAVPSAGAHVRLVPAAERQADRTAHETGMERFLEQQHEGAFSAVAHAIATWGATFQTRRKNRATCAARGSSRTTPVLVARRAGDLDHGRMRSVVWVISVAACYGPRFTTGIQCGPNDECPSTLVCAPATHTCETTLSGTPDAKPSDGTAPSDGQ